MSTYPTCDSIPDSMRHNCTLSSSVNMVDPWTDFYMEWTWGQEGGLLFPEEEPASASPSFPGTWVNFDTEASHQPPGSLSLQLLLRSMWLLLGGLNLEQQAHCLLAQTEDGKSSQAEPESQADWATSSVPVTAPKPTPEPEPSPWEGAEPESRTSGVSTRNSSRPQYNKRVGGSCLIHIYLENERTTKYKSILVTCQDRVPVIILRALDAHLLQQEDPENFELLQIVSNHQKLRIPDDGNIYYALDGRVDYNFLFRKQLPASGSRSSQRSSWSLLWQWHPGSQQL
ncbi:ral guanine nucleotide dissociation stimulator-like [Marmota flaviventris]|uniref:ral guanine nucleotide dissociation stimulator-like n=1 Tax=Marmota flaviventris TaxID=93162 RepID=UPI003A8C11EB